MQVLKAYKWVPFICAEENFSFPPPPSLPGYEAKKNMFYVTCDGYKVIRKLRD